MYKDKFNKMKKALISAGFNEDDVNQFIRYVPLKKTTSKKAKTIKQWLKEGLTPKQFENAKKDKDFRYNKDIEARSLKEAILNGFCWVEMPEGAEYWWQKYSEV